jgi:hypothetical protein
LGPIQAYYKFDEGTGTTSADATGDGYTCTLDGATWTSGNYATIPALNLKVPLPESSFAAGPLPPSKCPSLQNSYPKFGRRLHPG